MSKQYGLIDPKKGHEIGTLVKRPSVFGDDSDSDNGAQKKPTGLKQCLKRQDRKLQEKAVEEDPTVYQYDEIYEDMDQKRKESKLSRKDLDKKPKYIGKLLVSAAKRKRESERRIERQVQRDREAEGDEFAEKESFVTSAYKKKLEEMKELDEAEAREQYLESIGDVRKQGNLDGFYRHLYEQKVKYEDKKSDDESKKNCESENSANLNLEDVNENAEDNTDIKDEKRNEQKKRQYRKRKSDHSSDESSDKEDENRSENLDADSDFSIDSESENDEVEMKTEKVAVIEVKTEKQDEEVVASQEVKVKVEIDVVPEQKVKKPKIDIWKKRTVDKVFDEALQRYFERKALRESG